MVKTTVKQRTVDYESRSIYCDLCEEEVPEGQATITLMPSIARSQGERYMGGDASRIDICSVDCMVKNAGAAGLLLNTKIIPDLRTKMGTKSIKMDFTDFELEKKAYYDKADSKWPNVYGDMKKMADSMPEKFKGK